MDALKHALETFPGGQVALAKAIGTTPQFVSQWVNGKRPVPARFVLSIESALGGRVSRHDIAPHVFGPAPGAKAA